MIDYGFMFHSLFLSAVIFMVTLLVMKRNTVEFQIKKGKWYFIIAGVCVLAAIIINLSRFSGDETAPNRFAFYKVACYLFAWGIYLTKVIEKTQRSKAQKIGRVIVMILASIFYFGTPGILPTSEAIANNVMAEIYRKQTLELFNFAVAAQVVILFCALLLRNSKSKNSPKQMEVSNETGE